jgi:hypothetical protein
MPLFLGCKTHSLNEQQNGSGELGCVLGGRGGGGTWELVWLPEGNKSGVELKRNRGTENETPGLKSYILQSCNVFDVRAHIAGEKFDARNFRGSAQSHFGEVTK